MVVIGLFLSLLFLVGCVSQQPTGGGGGSGSRIAGLDTSPGKGRYKIGSPYQIQGVWYRPVVDYGYDEEGLASWYGPGFHGKLTANGEIFDTNQLSAAHRTLPMPSFARVTNLNNGRWLIVRVNDRGPYVNTKNRIIDLSRRAAQLLGFIERGTAEVRVQIMARESKKLADYMQRKRAFMDLVPESPGESVAESVAESGTGATASAAAQRLAALERERLLASPEAQQLTAELYNTIAVAAVLEQVRPASRWQAALVSGATLGTNLGGNHGSSRTESSLGFGSGVGSRFGL